MDDLPKENKENKEAISDNYKNLILDLQGLEIAYNNNFAVTLSCVGGVYAVESSSRLIVDQQPSEEPKKD